MGMLVANSHEFLRSVDVTLYDDGIISCCVEKRSCLCGMLLLLLLLGLVDDEGIEEEGGSSSSTAATEDDGDIRNACDSVLALGRKDVIHLGHELTILCDHFDVVDVVLEVVIAAVEGGEEVVSSCGL